MIGWMGGIADVSAHGPYDHYDSYTHRFRDLRYADLRGRLLMSLLWEINRVYVRLVAVGWVACLASPTTLGQEAAVVDAVDAVSEPVEDAAAAVPPALTEYMGRKIAPTMHFFGAPWLIRESRQREEDCRLMLENLGVRPGMTVCDMGCGNGFYALQLAKMVGADGKVLAVDIQSEMLRLLRARAEEAGIGNVRPILGTVVDPRLPVDQVDVILCVDVYHEFSHPEQMLAAMRKALKPEGYVALLEFRGEDPEVPIKPLHKMTKQQAIEEFAANGFQLVKQYDQLPWQHMLFFGRADRSDPASP